MQAVTKFTVSDVRNIIDLDNTGTASGESGESSGGISDDTSADGITTVGQQERLGGAFAMAEAYGNTMDKINTYNSNNSPNQQELEDFINFGLAVDVNETEVSNFAAAIIGGGTIRIWTTANEETAVNEVIFCANSPTQDTMFAAAYEVSSNIPDHIQQIKMFTDMQWQTWFDAGTAKPRTGVKEVECFIFPEETLEITPSTPQVLGEIIHVSRAEQLFEIRLSGTYTDTDTGKTYDGLFEYDTDGSVSFSPVYVGWKESSEIGVQEDDLQPASDEVTYSSGHSYIFQVRRQMRDAEYNLGGNMPTNWTGKITATIKHLGGEVGL